MYFNDEMQKVILNKNPFTCNPCFSSSSLSLLPSRDMEASVVCHKCQHKEACMGGNQGWNWRIDTINRSLILPIWPWALHLWRTWVGIWIFLEWEKDLGWGFYSSVYYFGCRHSFWINLSNNLDFTEIGDFGW